MIPKVIHYCWFGRGPKPALFQKCLSSWKKYCPDYEIVEWNENNFDIESVPYVKEAYQAKKWAFVTDYVRLWVIYNHGGIYLDTDVELIRSMDDLLNNPAFFGFEDEKSIATGLGFGAEKNNSVVGLMLKDYDGVHFLKDDGSFDLTTCPVRNTNSVAHLLPLEISGIVRIDGAVIYPPEWFCPLSTNGVDLNKTKNTHSIHWFTASWLSADEMIVHEWRIFSGKCEKRLGKKLGNIFARVVYLFKPQKRNVLKRM